jgi:large subunit ribosomal protein L13
MGKVEGKFKRAIRTFSLKPADVKRSWVLIDASDDSLGRIATEVAKRLSGKHKVDWTPHVDGGDYVVVINSDKLIVSGNKETEKMYYNHSGYPGGLRERKLEELRKRDSTEIIYNAVRGMISGNKLRESMLNRLKIYKDENHKHEAQGPVLVSLKRNNNKEAK